MADINSGSMSHSIVKSFDEVSESLKTTIMNAAVDISVSAFTDSIAIADASGNKATTTLVGSKRGLDVNIIDISLSQANDSVSLGDGTNPIGSQSVNSVVGLAVTDLNKAPMSFIVDEVDASTTYLGWAAPGASESSSVWRVRKITVSGTVTKYQWANGTTNFTNQWSNRLSLSYS